MSMTEAAPTKTAPTKTAPTKTAPTETAPTKTAPQDQPKWHRSPCRDSGGDQRSLQLADRISELSRSISSLQRDLLLHVAEFDRTEAWRGDGAVSMAAWLTERCGISSTTAWAWTRTATKLESLPRLTSALADGTLSFDTLALLTRVAKPSTDAKLAKEAVHLSVKQVRELVASHKDVKEVDATTAAAFEARTLRLNDAKCTIWARLAKDDYAQVKAGIVAALRGRDPLHAGGWSEGGTASDAAGPPSGGDPTDYIPLDQRLCDVFVDLFRSTHTMPVQMEGQEGRSQSPGANVCSTGVRPTLVLHADFGWLTGSCRCGSAGEEGGEIPGLGSLARQTARRLACDAGIVFSMEARDGSILDQKRLRRSPTTLQRIEIARRDKGCRFPGCPFVDFTEVHHIVPWDLGGETNQSNLMTLCTRHHHAVHELGWSLKGNPDDLMTFTGPHGHVMKSMPSPTWRRAGPMRR
jgi:hypothetical protein